MAFAISWGGVVAVVGPDGFPGTPEQFDALILWAVAAMLAGPSVAGLLFTAVLDGTAGLKALLARMTRWRVGARWHAVALLTAPAVLTVTLLPLSLISPAYTPGFLTTSELGAHLSFALAVGLAAGLFEELGWTGFAVPRMRARHGPLATGLALGLIWGAWHLLASWWGSDPSSGGVSMAVYLPVVLFSFLPPYRVLMVWVYDRTGSLLVGMLMHASLTGSIRAFEPIGISGAALLVYNLIMAALLWLAVASIVLRGRGRIERN